MRTKIFMMIVIAAVFTFSSCKKDSNDGAIEDASVNLADDDAVAEVVYDDVFNTADNATIILDETGNPEAKSVIVLADSCPSITFTRPTANLWPKIVTVDYGASCSGMNDNVRSGKIIIEVTGPRMQAGSKRTVTFTDYYFNDIKVEGTKVIETIGLNNNQNLTVTVELNDGKLTFPDNTTILRSASHLREWTAGILTRNIWDDECLITGTATGENVEGVSYTNTILTALHWQRACRFIVSGVVKIEREGAPVVQIDYGTGDCDAKAVVTSRDVSREILLKNRLRNMWNW
jgi:hypothetical protein